MSEIAVGDLVVAVRACCNARYSMSAGWIFKVSDFHNGRWSCGFCGIRGTEKRAIAVEPSIDKECSPLSWLRRIPPISELDETEHKEELLA